MLKNKKTFLITTPIYYPSGELHIGHLYTTNLAKTIANYKSLQGYDVKFLTGIDEHGQKIMDIAKKNNLSAQKYVDQQAQKIQKLWKDLQIDYDYFSRTTNLYHQQVVQKIFNKIQEKNDIYLDKYEGFYSQQDEEFVTKTQAIQAGKNFLHPISKHPLQFIEEESFFLKVKKYQNWLLNFFKENQNFVYPQKVVKELINNFLDKGLDDLSITRKQGTWGISVEKNQTHVIYVWLDALSNYLSALGYLTNKDQDYQKYWANGHEIVHIIGKEISRFHIIYWPIILKILNLKFPTKIIAHSWIITPTGKMSKSKNNIINPYDLINKYDVEFIKYFFAAKIKIEIDSIFNEKLFKDVINAEIINNYGNLVFRTIGMFIQNFQKPLKYQKSQETIDQKMEKNILDSLKNYQKNCDLFLIDKALAVAINLSHQLNKYIDLTMPWKLKNNLPRLSQILLILLNGIYAISVYLSIVMPNNIKKILKRLKILKIDLTFINDFHKFDNIILEKGKPIFERI